jgi:signal transduction histidine kinase
MGLASIFGIVKQWGGTMNIESESGEGTCVSVIDRRRNSRCLYSEESHGQAADA